VHLYTVAFLVLLVIAYGAVVFPCAFKKSGTYNI